MSWLDLLTGRRRQLEPLERRLLDELIASIGGDNATLLTAQCDRINLVQRDAAGRETSLYQVHHGKPVHDATIRLPLESRDHRLATIEFELPEGLFSAEFHAVDGVLFSIEFMPGAAHVLHRSEIKIRDIAIDLGTAASSSRAAEEALTQPSEDSAPQRSFDSLRWMARAQETRAPLRESDRARLGSIDAKLPADYVSSLEISDGYLIDGVEVLSLADVYDIPLPTASYYVLAKVGDRGLLAVRRRSADDTVHLLPFDDDGTAVGVTFRDALAAAHAALAE